LTDAQATPAASVVTLSGSVGFPFASTASASPLLSELVFSEMRTGYVPFLPPELCRDSIRSTQSCTDTSRCCNVQDNGSRKCRTSHEQVWEYLRRFDASVQWAPQATHPADRLAPRGVPGAPAAAGLAPAINQGAPANAQGAPASAQRAPANLRGAPAIARRASGIAEGASGIFR
jgi:hypothetical protein